MFEPVPPVSHKINPNARFRAVGPSWKPYHSGVDFLCPSGTPVRSPESGRVTRIYRTTYGGLHVAVLHENGLTTEGAHLLQAKVKPGQAVAKGEVIALSGNSGKNTTGAHLHLAMRDRAGRPVDPEPWFHLEEVSALGNRLAVLDPAGGGIELGPATASGVPSSRINLMVAQVVRSLLEASGVEVVMTRDVDREMSAAERVAACNAVDADCLVSICCAGSSDANARGIECFALPGSAAQRLAERIGLIIGEAVRVPNAGVRTNHRPPILTDTRPSAALVSCGYLSNAVDAALLQEPTFRHQVAVAVTTAVLAWMAAERSR